MFNAVRLGRYHTSIDRYTVATTTTTSPRLPIGSRPHHPIPIRDKGTHHAALPVCALCDLRSNLSILPSAQTSGFPTIAVVSPNLPRFGRYVSLGEVTSTVRSQVLDGLALPPAPVPFRSLAEGAPARHCINSKPQGVTEPMTGFIVAFINQKRIRKVEVKTALGTRAEGVGTPTCRELHRPISDASWSLAPSWAECKTLRGFGSVWLSLAFGCTGGTGWSCAVCTGSLVMLDSQSIPTRESRLCPRQE
jgi:hypothetical protein